MKKVTLALVLIAALCLVAVSPVMAYTWSAPSDPYAAKNVTAKYNFATNTVTFPAATYKPSIAPTLDKTFAAPAYKPSIAATLDKTFAVSAMSTLTTSSGGKYVVVKFPWE
jgi:hypothetical protein